MFSKNLNFLKKLMIVLMYWFKKLSEIVFSKNLIFLLKLMIVLMYWF